MYIVEWLQVAGQGLQVVINNFLSYCTKDSKKAQSFTKVKEINEILLRLKFRYGEDGVTIEIGPVF
jgi:hypothetical protein